MPQSKEEIKFTVISRLLKGDEPGIIAMGEDIPKATVLRLKRELDEARLNNSVHELINLDKAVMDTMLSQIQKTTPSELVTETEQAVETVRHARQVAEALQFDFQQTASQINIKIRALTMSTQSIGEVATLTETLCALQNAFFNKNSTQVNVQNNYGNSEQRKYGNFLSDKPADYEE